MTTTTNGNGASDYTAAGERVESPSAGLSDKARRLMVEYARAHQYLGAAETVEGRHAAALLCAEAGGALVSYLLELEAR